MVLAETWHIKEAPLMTPWAKDVTPENVWPEYPVYEDGTEELYDHDNDPMEWENLANNPDYAKIKQQCAKWLPKESAPALEVIPIKAPEWARLDKAEKIALLNW